MDPSTTLFTFMLQTDPSVHFVHLVGSWDNFSTYRAMERDTRRGLGQWRGCYSFHNTICDDENGKGFSKKNGGLRMGSTYYYFYELDGSKEIHDPAMPSTSACPSLPGQQLNTLSIPVEHSLRHRSASLSSMRCADHKTMNPKDRFITPRPPPRVPEPQQPQPPSRVDSAPTLGPSSSFFPRSVSPAPSWKRFLPFKMNKGDGERGRSMIERPVTPASSVMSMMDDAQSITSEGSRTRDISPESLRRFLCDDAPPTPAPEERPTLVIPEDIAEENEDDDNFATSAVSEHNFFSTSLSPPPTKTHGLSPSISTADLGLCPPPARKAKAKADSVPKPEPLVPMKSALAEITTDDGPRSHFSISTVASSVASPLSAHYPGDDAATLEPSERDDTSPSASSIDVAIFGYRRSSISAYHLPEDGSRKDVSGETRVAMGSPTMLEDWMANIIYAKSI